MRISSVRTEKPPIRLEAADKCRKRRTAVKVNWELYALVFLPLVWLAIFQYYPMYGNIIAFKRFSPGIGIWKSEWVGFYYFARFLRSYRFFYVLRNTVVLNLYNLAAGFPIPIILAILIHYCPLPRYRKSVQMLSYAPHFISTVVMVGIIGKLFAMRIGIVNLLLERIGLPTQNFLGSTQWFAHVYTWTGVWQGMGWGTIIYLAALSAVDDDLHDAAKVDGANIWVRIWHVDIQGILPTVVILLILRTGQVVNIGFEKIFLLQNNLNIAVSEVIATYVYKIGIASAMPIYSYAAAIGLFQSLINFALLLTVNRIAKKLGETSLW